MSKTFTFVESINTTLEAFKSNIKTINAVYDALISNPKTDEKTLNAFTTEGIDKLNQVISFTKNVIVLPMLSDKTRDEIKPNALNVNKMAHDTILRLLDSSNQVQSS